MLIKYEINLTRINQIPKKNKILLKKGEVVRQIKFREICTYRKEKLCNFHDQPVDPSIQIQRQNLRREELFLAKLLAIWHQRTVCCFQERRLEKAQHATEKGWRGKRSP